MENELYLESDVVSPLYRRRRC